MTGGGKPSEDAEVRDRLEEEAKMVHTPGVSKKPLDPFGVSEKPSCLEYHR
jgi:hypothetical protein